MKAKEYFEKYVNENQDESKEWRFIKCLQEMILKFDKFFNIDVALNGL